MFVKVDIVTMKDEYREHFSNLSKMRGLIALVCMGSQDFLLTGAGTNVYDHNIRPFDIEIDCC